MRLEAAARRLAACFRPAHVRPRRPAAAAGTRVAAQESMADREGTAQRPAAAARSADANTIGAPAGTIHRWLGPRLYGLRSRAVLG